MKFGIDAVTEVSGATSANIRDWAQRGLLRTHLEKAGRGKVRQYTIDNIIEFTILKQFSEMGIPLRIQGYLWDMVKPNSLSEAGGWIFVYYPENVDRSTHMNWLMIQPEQINWQHLFGYGPKNSWAVVVLDIAHLIHEVRDKLNTYSAVN